MRNQREDQRNQLIRDLTDYMRTPGVPENLMRKKKIDLISSPDKLVFIGMADMAEYFWCAEKSLLKSRSSEVSFFESYLSDRVLLSFDLGRLDRLPVQQNKLLSVGDDINKADIEALLKEKRVVEADNELNFKVAQEGTWRSLGVVNGVIYVMGFPDEGAREINTYNQEIREVVFVDSVEDPALPPMLRGVVGESAYAERYSTIRWNFRFGEYVLEGQPDGITDDFVYEFKTTKNDYTKKYIKPVADTQADLYAHFFGRRKKRVQIRNYERRKIFTYETSVDEERVKAVYEGFNAIDNGDKPIPPLKWKCKVCELKLKCPISQA
jgi:CRISPR/Cas system-associated exonuclease Cas4 (RecB family)